MPLFHTNALTAVVQLYTFSYREPVIRPQNMPKTADWGYKRSKLWYFKMGPEVQPKCFRHEKHMRNNWELRKRGYLIRFGHTEALLFKKKRTLNGHFSRPAETDPYMLILTQLGSLFECQENPTESLEGGILQLMVACEGSRRLCCGSRKAGAWSVFFQYNQIRGSARSGSGLSPEWRQNSSSL